MLDLESQLPQDHRARLVWAFVEGLDLGEFYARIMARQQETKLQAVRGPACNAL